MGKLVLLNRDIKEFDTLRTAFNTDVKVIEYVKYDTIESIESQINNLTEVTLDNLCIIFSDNHSGNSKFAGDLDFITPDLETNEVYKLIKNIKTRFNIQTIDFLACNLLKYDTWKNYFQYLGDNLNVLVRASDDATGNLKNGADWILETTGEDIKSIYFNETIEEWNGILDFSTAIYGIITKNSTTNEIDYYTWGSNSTFGAQQYGELGMISQDQSARQVDNYNQTIKTSGDWRDSKVSFGNNFGGMITVDEKVYTFGYNQNYQLGTGNLISSPLPQLILDGAVIGKTFKKIVCGIDFSYVLTDDGRVYCWGNNRLGQAAGLVNTQTPQLMTGGIFDGVIDDICVGHLCAACITNNKVYAWGQNSFLQVPARNASGVLITTTAGSSVSYSTPIEVTGIPDTPLRVFGGWTAASNKPTGFACLTSENQIWVWGHNAGLFGFGGNGQFQSFPTVLEPRQHIYAAGKIPIYMSFGNGVTITLMSDGTLYGTGRNDLGYLANTGFLSGSAESYWVLTPTIIDKVYQYNTATMVTLPPITKINTSLFSTTLLGNDGLVYVMGRTIGGESWNQRYIGFYRAVTPPSKLITDIGNRTVEMAYTSSGSIPEAYAFVWVLTTDNKLYNINSSVYGENLSKYNTYTYYPIKFNPRDQLNLTNPGDVIEYRQSQNFQAVLTTNGHLYTIGYNVFGQLGIGSVYNAPSWGNGWTHPSIWVRASGPLLTRTVTKFSLGMEHAGAVTDDGNCYMWGRNNLYQLGISSSNATVTTPTLLTISGETIVDIACSNYYTLWLTSSGKVYSAGNNDSGQLGVGNTTSSTSANFQPQLINYFVTNNKTITKIICGGNHSMAIDSQGKLFTWGSNGWGQLGDGTSTNRNTPTPITTNISTKTIIDISAGDVSSIILSSDGEVYVELSNVFTKVNLGSEFATWIRDGGNQWFIKTLSNKLYVSGRNGVGQLLTGTFTEINTPTHNTTVSTIIPNATIINQSKSVSSLILNNNVSTNLLAFNLNSVTANFANFIDAEPGSISINSVSYSSSIYNSAGIGNAFLVPFSLTPNNVSFSNYITLDYNFNWNESVRVYYGTTQISTSDTGLGVFYSLPNSSTVRIHTNKSGNFGLYNFIDVPGAPRNVSATKGVSSATITFNAPLSNGGADITLYTVTVSPGNTTVTGSGSPIVVSNLDPNTNYFFTVSATNIAGAGLNSSNSNSIRPIGIPNVPNNVSAEAFDRSALVSFELDYNGGSNITSYTVISSPGNITVNGLNSPILVNGLTNGTEYTFRVLATNIAGSSQYSTSSTGITPIQRRNLTVEQTTSVVSTFLTAAKNTANLDRTEAKTNLRSLLNEEKTNKMIETTVDKIIPLAQSSILNPNSTQKIEVILLDEIDTTPSEEQPIIDITQPILNGEIVYFPVKGGEQIKFKANGKIYTAVVSSEDNLISTVIINDRFEIVDASQIFDKLEVVIFGSVGLRLKMPSLAGAGSDPYITSLYNYTFELPHIERWWNLFNDEANKFMILAQTKNYKGGNYFSQIKIISNQNKIIIDYLNKKIETLSITDDVKIGKTNKLIKYKKGKEIIEENKLFDCIQMKHPTYEEVVFLINWRNDYFHPIFKVLPEKASGLLMMEAPPNYKPKH